MRVIPSNDITYVLCNLAMDLIYRESKQTCMYGHPINTAMFQYSMSNLASWYAYFQLNFEQALTDTMDDSLLFPSAVSFLIMIGGYYML